ncbi:MAG: hypothetical protein Q4C27_05260, partial [Eubacteriales bacterium]|nr:hypothetical protein [Eubacteriales bacterium]
PPGSIDSDHAKHGLFLFCPRDLPSHLRLIGGTAAARTPHFGFLPIRHILSSESQSVETVFSFEDIRNDAGLQTYRPPLCA